MTTALNRMLVALVAVLLAVVGLGAAASAHGATTTPPWEPDPNAVGTLSFYNAAGNVITSGRTDTAPFAAYVAGSAAIRAGDTQAGVYFANPDSTKSTTYFARQLVGNFTTNPTTGTPASITALSQTRPVNAGGSTDLTLNDFESTAVKSTAAGYENVVQIRMRTANNGQQGLAYETADLLIDPTANTWTEIYPTPPPITTAGAPGTYVAVSPTRVLDTRAGVGAPKAAVAAHGQIAVQVTSGSVPAGVAAVVVNVTATGSTAGGFVTVWADDATRPTASNLNYAKGQTVPNLVVAPVGADGKIDLYNGSPGTVQLIADVSGYFVGGSPTAGGTFAATSPTRVLDTRAGVGAPKAAVKADDTVAVQVTGGVVPAGVSAVVVNVTVTQPQAGGFITAYADGSTKPAASNLNFVANQTVPNLVVAPVGADGKIDLYSGSKGTVQLIADVAGYFLGGGPSVPGSFGAIVPSRVLDTRSGTGAPTGPVASHATVAFSVVGGSVPAGVTAVVLNVTVTQPQVAGFVTAWADGSAKPAASNLNFVAKQTVPNLVVAPVGPDGKVDLYNGSLGTVQFIADVSGYITGSG